MSISHRAPQPVTAHMPLELVIAIMETAAFDDDLEANSSLLRACALVCRDWSVVAQKLLFRNVSLRTRAAYDAFRSAANRSTTRGRMLGDAVTRMRVVLDHNQPFGLTEHAFAHAVGLCPNLFELNLALYGCACPGDDIIGSPDILRMRRPAPSFDARTLSMLKAGPRIAALQFSNWSENRHSIVQLLDVWPTLKSLVISGTPPELHSPSPAPFPCALDELRMNFQASPSVEFLKWLLHNSTDTLRILRLERETSSEVLAYLANAHGNALESVSLSGCSHVHARALQKCQRLRRFSVESPLASPLAYRGLPEEIEHLAFGLDKDTSLLRLLETVKSKLSLKAVTVHIWNGGELHPELASLQIACAYRGIDLQITKDIRVFRTALVRAFAS